MTFLTSHMKCEVVMLTKIRYGNTRGLTESALPQSKICKEIKQEERSEK